jgi:hypothetical protein
MSEIEMMAFKVFMAEVDQEIADRCGLTSSDLADYAYYDAFRDDVPPEEVAEAVLEEEGFFA